MPGVPKPRRPSPQAGEAVEKCQPIDDAAPTRQFGFAAIVPFEQLAVDTVVGAVPVHPL
jgi:hypothetical protein